VVVDLAAVPVTGTSVLAQDPAPPPGQGPEFGEASPIALVVVLVLGAALVVLIRSMTKHLRRVPASFDPPAEPEPGRSDEGPPGDRPAG
jgi:hypothetical protein